jgi:hypothetical protein
MWLPSVSIAGHRDRFDHSGFGNQRTATRKAVLFELVRVQLLYRSKQDVSLINFMSFLT